MIKPMMLLPPVIFAALAAIFYIGMVRDDPDVLPSTFVGRAAPMVSPVPVGPLPTFDRAELNKPGLKLVNFWASWCAPCRVEHPNLTILQKEGMAIYGINYKDTVENGLGFLDELGDPYVAVGADPEGRTGLEWGVYGLPETFLIDGDGTVLLRLAGALTERALAERLRPALAKLN